MEDNLKKISKKVETQLQKIENSEGLDKIKNEFLGRKGEVTQILGQKANELRKSIIDKLESKKEALKKEEITNRM